MSTAYLEDRAREFCLAHLGSNYATLYDGVVRIINEFTERAAEAARADTQALCADVDAASKRLCRREGETLLAAVEALNSARWRDDAERAKLATEAEAARGEVERLRDDVLHARLLAAQRDDKLKAAHAEAARLRERLAVGVAMLRKVAGLHMRYCEAEERSDEEREVLNAFDDLCCDEIIPFVGLEPPFAATPAAPVTPAEPTCARCGAPFAPEGNCSRRNEGCQGGRGEGRG